jgi:hypothetical protein
MRVLPAAAAMVVLAAAAAGDEGRMVMPAALAARVTVGAAAGRVVEVEPDGSLALVTVSQTVQPLPGDPHYPLTNVRVCDDPTALDVASHLELPPELAELRAHEHGVFAVVTGVVSFVGRAVAQDDDDRGPQDAASVLARGRGRCSGRANLAVALLRVLGVPARVVHGVLATDRGPRWHRWGEAWLGPSHWVAFDPGASVGVVSVRYLEVAGAEEGTSLSDLVVRDIEEPRFAGLPRRGGLRVLPVGGASLRCMTDSATTAITAVLVAADGTRWARQGRGEVVFTRMLPGAYTLAWRTGNETNGVVRLDLWGAREVRVN